MMCNNNFKRLVFQASANTYALTYPMNEVVTDLEVWSEAFSVSVDPDKVQAAKEMLRTSGLLKASCQLLFHYDGERSMDAASMRMKVQQECKLLRTKGIVKEHLHPLLGAEVHRVLNMRPALTRAA
eukprot:3996723-Amphidinium_carterae.4